MDPKSVSPKGLVLTEKNPLKLEKELRHKEKALATAAALLTLSRKTMPSAASTRTINLV